MDLDEIAHSERNGQNVLGATGATAVALSSSHVVAKIGVAAVPPAVPGTFRQFLSNGPSNPDA